MIINILIYIAKKQKHKVNFVLDLAICYDSTLCTSLYNIFYDNFFKKKFIKHKFLSFFI